MKALLLYPEFPHKFWSYRRALRFIGKRATLPPLGLLTVAAMLPEGWGSPSQYRNRSGKRRVSRDALP